MLAVWALLTVAALDRAGRTARISAALLCTLLFAFSLAGLQDYFSWNRARWDGVAYLLDEVGADPVRVDGGYEYNGLHTSGLYMQMHDTGDFYDQGPAYWWVLDDTYAIDFSPRPGYLTLRRIPYFTWLGFRTNNLYVQRKIGAP
jgi:hypothetical protein